MHISNLVSSAPATPRSDTRADLSRDSGFGAVFGAGERPAPDSAARQRDTGGAEETAAASGNEAGSASTKEHSPERPADAEEPEETAVVGDGGAPVAEVEPDPSAAEVPTDDADAPVAGSDTQHPEIPNEVVLAAAEAPAPRAPSRPGAEAETPRVVPQAARQATPPAAEAAAPAEEPAPSAPREAPSPKVAASAVPQAAQAAPAAHAAAGAQATRARPVATEEVTVRRVRADEPAPADRAAGIRTDSPPRSEANVPRPATPAAAPVDPLAKTSPEVARPDVVDPALAEIASTEGRSTADQTARAEATVRHDTPRPVMQQVAEAARALRDGPVELTMQPEELGKVKMTLSAGAEGAMTLTVQTERPETLDLLRRHIGELARELQDMGFDNLSFSFGQDRASAERQNEPHRDDDAGDRPLAAIPLSQQGFAARSAPAVTVGGLDIRL